MPRFYSVLFLLLWLDLGILDVWFKYKASNWTMPKERRPTTLAKRQAPLVVGATMAGHVSACEMLGELFSSSKSLIGACAGPIYLILWTVVVHH